MRAFCHMIKLLIIPVCLSVCYGLSTKQNQSYTDFMDGAMTVYATNEQYSLDASTRFLEYMNNSWQFTICNDCYNRGILIATRFNGEKYGF